MCTLDQVQKLLCVEGTFAKHCSETTDPPISLDVFVDGVSAAVCAKSVVRNTFDIHDIDNLEQLSGLEQSDPLPWLRVETVVEDFSNFGTGEHRRHLDLEVLAPYGTREFKPL